jgi:nicotinamide-nucleotide amidase
VRCDLLAVGTELLLGQIVDTNSSWLGEQLAAAGIDSYEHVRIGDNQARVVAVLRRLLEEADAVIVCGGLGPTPDDLTRDAIAEVMGVPLERHDEIVDHIRSLFGSRGRTMAENNLRQADVPAGARVLWNPIGTAPGLAAPVGEGKVVYAVPGVPYEMTRMVTEHVLPDLLVRSGERAVIRSRSLRTWGASESGLAEMIADRVDAQTNPTIAFLARGIEGLYVRMTAKAATEAEAEILLDAEDLQLRAILGDLVFGVDDETIEHAVITALARRGWTLAVAESLTGGLVQHRVVDVPGASTTFRGGVVAYTLEAKQALLGVTATDPVSEECAIQMADGVRRVLGADVGLATTGVAGPTEHAGHPVGTVVVGLALPDRPTEAVVLQMPGDRDRIRSFTAITAANLLRQRIAGVDAGELWAR